MDKEKLNEAASTASDNAVFDSDHWNNYNEGFVKGADWLMQQPLADRLTEEEKQRIRIMLDSTKLESLSTVQTAFQKGVAECLDTIFGKDLFNEK